MVPFEVKAGGVFSGNRRRHCRYCKLSGKVGIQSEATCAVSYRQIHGCRTTLHQEALCDSHELMFRKHVLPPGAYAWTTWWDGSQARTRALQFTRVVVTGADIGRQS